MQSDDILKRAFSMLNELYPLDAQYEFAFASEKQLDEIEKLKYTVPYEQFFFVLNLANRQLEYVNGVNSWLGYSNEQFSLYDYFKIIHPFHLSAITMSAMATFDTANSGEFNVKFMQHRVVAHLPLLNSNGKYYLTKRTLYPFQMDKISKKITAYLNHFVIIKEYHELDTLDLRVGNESIFGDGPEEGKVLKSRRMHVLNHAMLKTFNHKEIKLLNLLAENPEITQKEMAETLQIKLDTLRKTTNSRILSKARELTGSAAFQNLKEVALYLKKEGLL